MVKPLRLFSWTRCSKDEECQRARYYSREWGGTGLTPTQAGWNLVYGNIIHKALEELAKTNILDVPKWKQITQQSALDGGFNAVTARDWSALCEGQLRGFFVTIWPRLMSEYDIVEGEKWIVYDVEPGYRFRARQDLLLRNKFDGHLTYIDYKTTSSHKPQWIAAWAKSVQLHSSMYALRQAENVDVQRAVVIGFYKGYTDDKTKLLRSPFTYGYVNREYTLSPQYSYKYKAAKGWELFPVAEEFGDVGQWMADMPPELLTEQFPMTGPIFPRDDIATKWFRQQLIREKAVDEAITLLQTSTSVEEIEGILDKYFRQNFSKCEPAFGYPCEFRNICWIPWIEADPLGSGQFKIYEAEDLDG